MTDAAAPQDAVLTHRWDHRPVFSVHDKGGRITWLAPGRVPGRLTAGLLAEALLSAAPWTALTLLGTSLLCNDTATGCLADVGRVGQGWLIAGLLVIGYLSLWITVDLGERARDRLGQRRAASFFYLAPLLTGIMLGAGAQAVSGLGPDPAETWRLTLEGRFGTEGIAVSAAVAVAAAVWGLTIAARLSGALRHARDRQRTIDRLRRDGQRYAGQVHLGSLRFWLHNEPELDVTVTYESPVGRHQVAARLRSTPDQVPKNGSRVVVLTDLQGGLHIELDRDAAPEFEPEGRYTPSE